MVNLNDEKRLRYIENPQDELIDDNAITKTYSEDDANIDLADTYTGTDTVVIDDKDASKDGETTSVENDAETKNNNDETVNNYQDNSIENIERMEMQKTPEDASIVENSSQDVGRIDTPLAENDPNAIRHESELAYNRVCDGFNKCRNKTKGKGNVLMDVIKMAFLGFFLGSPILGVLGVLCVKYDSKIIDIFKMTNYKPLLIPGIINGKGDWAK